MPKPRQPAQPTSRTRPRLGWCTRCRAPIFGCLYDALPIKLDVYRLSPIGELQSHLLKLETWLICNGHLSRRTVWAIQTSPNGLGGMVVRTHRCGEVIPWGDMIQFESGRYENDQPDF